MLHRPIRPWAGAPAALGLLLVYTLPLGGAAQQPAPGAPTVALLQGIVVSESTGQAVEAATVSLVGTDIETQTGRYGGFAFPDAPLGKMSVRVTAPGYPSVVQEVEVKGDGIVFVRFLLPSVAAVLSQLLVGVRRDRPLAAGSLTAADLLAFEAPSTRVTSGNIGKTDYAIQLRASANTFNLSSEPLVLIDGVMIGLGQVLETLSQIPASDVLDIEVLTGPAAMARYPLAANGVVLVKTRWGRGRR